MGVERPIDVIHNFSAPGPARRSRQEVRLELGLDREDLIFHASNLRPVKRIDLLLETAARIRPKAGFKLLILAGGDFAPFSDEVRRLDLADRVIVRENILAMEDYLQAADLGLFTSDSESFCLGILEAMCFGCPSVATAVGGIPELVVPGVTGELVPANDADALARAVEFLLANPARRRAMGEAGRRRARENFSAAAIVPRYEELYRRVCRRGSFEPEPVA